MSANARSTTRIGPVCRCVALLGALALAFEVSTRAQGGVSATPPPPPPPPNVAVRDAPPPAPRTMPIGTASLIGVITAADTGRPLKNVRVTIVGSVIPAGTAAPLSSPTAMPTRGGGPVTVVPLSRSVVTDAQGQFSFQRLPAGDFNLSATRSQYLTTSYGQRKPGRPGTRIMLGDGQQLRVNLSLVRGGVITGVVIGDDGDPMSNAQVRALRYMYVNGFKRLQQSGYASTDDRGVYRLFNLQPGEYVIAATPNPSDFNLADRMMSEAVITERAIAGASLASGPAGQQAFVTLPAQVQARPGPMPGYLPTYFPGAISPVNATTVNVNAGDERSGIDIQVQVVQATVVQGTIAGLLPENTRVQVSLIPDDSMTDLSIGGSMTGPDGRFQFPNVAPGTYTLYAQATAIRVNTIVSGPTGFISGSTPPTPPRLEDSQKFWARTQIRVDGQPTLEVSASLQPPRTISGVVVSSGDTPVNFSQTRLTVTLGTAPTAQQIPVMGPLPTAQVGSDGRFVLTGVTPGRYTIRTNGKVVKSVTAGSDDILDFPLDFTGDRDLTDVTVTVTDKQTELSGTLSDSLGKPALDYVILLAPRDPRYWTPGSRRIMTTRPDSRGRFSFYNPPAGEYLVAALTDLEPGMQFDPEFLKSLGGASMPVSITEGIQQTQDIRLAR